MKVKMILLLVVVSLMAGCGKQNPKEETIEKMSQVTVDNTEETGMSIEYTSEAITDETITEIDFENIVNNVEINTQSSIRINGSKILYFDAIEKNIEMNDADFIFITHEHSDHFERNSIENVCNEKTVVVAPASMRSQILDMGLNEAKCRFFEPGENDTIDGIEICAVHAYNINKNYHPKDKNWLGYFVTMDGVRYYIAGDTDANEDVRKVNCDIAFVPIGGTYTMDWKEAADYILDTKPCKIVVPIHYGSVVGDQSYGVTFKNEIENKTNEIIVKLFF